MIEFILILVLTVAIVMALSKGVGRPLQKYLQSNVVDIVGCMLRVGQFPTKSFGLCTAAAKTKFDFKGSFSGVAGTGDASSKNNSKNNKDSGKDGGEKNGDNNSTANKKQSKPAFRSSSSTGSLNESNSNGSDDSDTKTIKIATDLGGGKHRELGFSEFSDSDGQTVIIRRIHKNGRISSSFFLSSDENSEGGDATGVLSSAVTQQPLPLNLLEDSNVRTSFSIPKSRARGPAGETPDAKMEFSFFGILKWGAIIVVLAVFGFFSLSQLNSIRKGWTD